MKDVGEKKDKQSGKCSKGCKNGPPSSTLCVCVCVFILVCNSLYVQLSVKSLLSHIVIFLLDQCSGVRNTTVVMTLFTDPCWDAAGRQTRTRNRIRSSSLAHSLVLESLGENTKQRPPMWPFNWMLPCLTSMKRPTSPSMATRAISSQLRQEERPGHMGAALWSALSLPRGHPGVTELNTLTVLAGQGRRKKRQPDGG